MFYLYYPPHDFASGHFRPKQPTKTLPSRFKRTSHFRTGIGRAPKLRKLVQYTHMPIAVVCVPPSRQFRSTGGRSGAVQIPRARDGLARRTFSAVYKRGHCLCALRFSFCSSHRRATIHIATFFPPFSMLHICSLSQKGPGRAW